jgi:bifunctional non-homologous end joining protein LigD
VNSVEVEIDGRRLSLSNLEKVLYPAAGFTKGQVIDYYTRIAPFMLPHLRQRPITLKRYPNGVEGTFFYEKQCPGHRPPWVETVTVWSGSTKRNIDFCLVNDLPALVWVANLASLELHFSLSGAADLACPQSVVFDLDPGPPADVVTCCRVALLLHEVLDHLHLECVAKTSGSKGMQVYVPLNTPASYAQTTPFANAIARLLEQQHPELVVSNMRKELRRGKVLIDWSQNNEHKTTIGVYSLRAQREPTVSTPVTWDEVAATAASGEAAGMVFDAPTVLARAARHGDLFAPMLTARQTLPA